MFVDFLKPLRYILGTSYFIIERMISQIARLLCCCDIHREYQSTYQILVDSSGKSQTHKDISTNLDNHNNHNNGTVTIISYNIHYFNNSYGHNTFNKLVNFVNENRPDLILFQEITCGKNRISISEFANKINYPSMDYLENNCQSGFSSGNAIFARQQSQVNLTFPFGRWFARKNKKVLLWKTNILGVTCWLVNIHLNHDIFGLEQETQLQQLTRYLDTLEGDKIIMGDFNYPFTNKILNILNVLGDRYRNISLAKSTFPVIYPCLQLDKAFVTGNIYEKFNFQAEVIEVNHSDHFPIKLVLSLKNKPIK